MSEAIKQALERALIHTLNCCGISPKAHDRELPKLLAHHAIEYLTPNDRASLASLDAQPTSPQEAAMLDAMLHGQGAYLQKPDGSQEHISIDRLRLDAQPEAEQPTSGNWDEDLTHENGNYQCQCSLCNLVFIGHKRRVVCKKCDAAPLPASETELVEDTDPKSHARFTWYDVEAEVAKAIAQPVQPAPSLHIGLAHELWATAQLLPGEGIADGVSRIIDVLDNKQPAPGQEPRYTRAEVQKWRDDIAHAAAKMVSDAAPYGEWYWLVDSIRNLAAAPSAPPNKENE